MSNIYRIPSFISQILRNYKSISNTNRIKDKYEYLESTTELLTKYITTATLSILSHYDSRAYDDNLILIFENNSMGKWIDAIENGIKILHKISNTAIYANFYLDDSRNNNDLKEINVLLNQIIETLGESGIELERVSSSTMIKVLRIIVVIRNKIRHNRPDAKIVENIIQPLFKIIQKLLMGINFDHFVFWAKDAGTIYQLVGEHKDCIDDESNDDIKFWAESPFLAGKKVSDFYLVQFHYGQQKVYFLNHDVKNNKKAEFLCYENSVSQKFFVSYNWPEREYCCDSYKIDIEEYKKNEKFLKSSGLKWEKIPFDTANFSIVSRRGCVYCFFVILNIFDAQIEHVFYVGRTNNLKRRFGEYLKIAKKYDNSRKEVVAMFNTFGDQIRFKCFYEKKEKRREQVERMLFDILKPEVNIIKPSKTKGARNG